MNGRIVMRGVAGLVSVLTALAGVSPALGQNYQWARTVSTYGSGGTSTFNSTQSVTVDPSGNVWATDMYHNNLVKFDGSGNWLASSPLSYGDGLHSDAAGNIWAAGVVSAGNGCVTELSGSGAVIKQLIGSDYPWPPYPRNSVLCYPSDAAVDSSGNIWVSEWDNQYSALDKFSSTGALLAQYTLNAGFGGCYGVAIDTSGSIWVSAESGNGQIIKVSSTDGSILKQFGLFGSGNGQLNGPEALAFDSAGNLWVADVGNSRIEEFSSTGAYLGQFGSKGTGPGQFNGPQGLAFDAAGNLWVADTDNNRLQEFSPVPEPSTLVLLGIGAASLLAHAWRKRRRTA